MGPVVQQVHKRIKLASKVGLQPYLPLEGSCALLEKSQSHAGALPMTYVVVPCKVLWLKVGEVALGGWISSSADTILEL